MAEGLPSNPSTCHWGFPVALHFSFLFPKLKKDKIRKNADFISQRPELLGEQEIPSGLVELEYISLLGWL